MKQSGTTASNKPGYSTLQKETSKVRRSRDPASRGHAHPPIQPTQLLRKFFESFVFVASYGDISRRGRKGDVPCVVSLEKVGQKVLLVVRQPFE